MVPTAASKSAAKRLSSARRDAFGGGRLVDVIGGLALAARNRLLLELLDGERHLADFVLAAEARQNDIEMPAGEFAHRRAQFDGRLGDAAADQRGEQQRQRNGADRQPGHEASEFR